MEEDDLESTVESIISAIAYAFESIRRWDRAVGVGEVVNHNIFSTTDFIFNVNLTLKVNVNKNIVS